MAATKNRPRRVDYEYERAGTAAVFLFSEPLAGWRQATARARRTKADWALEVAGLLEGRYAECPKIALVSDNLNTHTKGAFYEVFEPPRARELVRRIEFCHTPKHGRLVEHRENELSSMTRQCVRGAASATSRRCTPKCRRGHRRQRHATRCRLADEGRQCAL